MIANKTKNDVAWVKLFEQHRILEQVDSTGTCSILASEINKVREARLMTKFEHKINLPRIFKQHNLAILPDSRRSYIIGRFNCYHELPQLENDMIHEYSLPSGLESISATGIYSESSALLCAQHAGIINDLLDDTAKLTVFGRMTTGEFNFSISMINDKSYVQKNLSISNAQIEIDSGYEGSRALSIVEAKNQSIDDFHIRQLYYPYRLWLSKLTKPVIPILLVYSNDIFSFYVYDFGDFEHYNSIKFIKAKRYRIVPIQIEIEDIRRILQTVKVTPGPSAIPFPQADRFERVIDLLTQLCAKGSLHQEEITTNYAFDIRQAQYYTNAGRYLGLIDRKPAPESGVVYSLTALGMLIMRKEPRMRNLALVELILSRKVFYEAVSYYLHNAKLPDNSDVVCFMEKAELSISNATIERRAQSVISWMRWIISLTVH